MAGTTIDLLTLLGPSRGDAAWRAECMGYRSYVFGNNPCYRKGSALRAAWQRGYDAASASPDPARFLI